MNGLKNVFAVAISLSVLVSGSLFAEDDVPENIFRWAADLESGAPHAFNPPWDPSLLVGAEKDLADSIAKKLNKTPVFFNNTWDGLIPGLNRNLYDAVIGGVEVTPEHQQALNLSIPYYITHGQLVVHKNSDIKDLASCDCCKIGVLKNTVTAGIVRDRDNLHLVQYTTEINAFLDIANGRLDGFLIDAPIAMYYAVMDPNLKLVGGAEGKIEYAVAMREADNELTAQVNAAIQEMIESGELRQIFETWNMWSPQVAAYYKDDRIVDIQPVNYEKFTKYFRFNPEGFQAKVRQYLSYLPALGRGALMTIQISICSMLLAIVVGFFLAIVRIYGALPVAALSRLYIEIVRGTPLLIQLYFIFYGLPSIGITLEPFTAGIVALGLNYAAFEAENYRAGILSVHQGQMEAARALGMTHWQGLRHVVIPQAFHVILPPVTNDFISLLKDSSLVSVITIIDLTFAYNLLSTTYYNYFGVGIMVAVIYLLMGLPFVQLARWAERRLRKEQRRSRV